MLWDPSCMWTKVPWTIVSLGNRPLDNCLHFFGGDRGDTGQGAYSPPPSDVSPPLISPPLHGPHALIVP